MAGSSTVYPFARTIAEEFGRNSSFRTPVVESIGTGGGIKLFCSGVGDKFIDFVNSSREIKLTEKKICNQNGITKIVEIKIGYDGIIIANSVKAKSFNLTKEQIFLALANEVPINGKLVKNPYQKWSDFDKSLPNQAIVVYGPPPTSGTRDSFVELVMEEACAQNKNIMSVVKNKKKCHIIRSDGKFIEAGENDNLIIQKLKNNKDALGILGYSYLEQNARVIKSAKIENVTPTFQNISSGKYSISRPLFIYFKKEHLPTTKGLKEFIKAMVSNNAIGEEGYLIDKGLIPSQKFDLEKMQKEILGGL